jgi:hypothetical protein
VRFIVNNKPKVKTMETELTENEKKIYINWFLERCYDQETEILWLLESVTEETAKDIKTWIDDITLNV